MKKLTVCLKLIIAAASLIGAASAFSQTNWYSGGEIAASAAPTISFSGFGSGRVAHTLGYSIETEYWLNQWTGTGVECGMYDYLNAQLGVLDHLSVMQSFRIIPFPSAVFWNRFAFGAKTGAETYLANGSKDVAFGPIAWFTLSPKFRVEGEILERTSGNGATGKLAVQFRF